MTSKQGDEPDQCSRLYHHLDAVWRNENPPPAVRASFELDYLTRGRVPDVLAAIERCGLSLVGHFTPPDEARWDHFYTPMEQRIEELRARHATDAEALAVLDQLAEPRRHRKHSDYYACEFCVACSNGGSSLRPAGSTDSEGKS